MELDISALKQLITTALEECTDPSVLDLIYKLLAFEGL